MIDWTGTYIITYNIIFGMKKGLTWVPRHSLKTSQGGGGVEPPQSFPWIRLWVSFSLPWLLAFTKLFQAMREKPLLAVCKGFEQNVLYSTVPSRGKKILTFLARKDLSRRLFVNHIFANVHCLLIFRQPMVKLSLMSGQQWPEKVNHFSKQIPFLLL